MKSIPSVAFILVCLAIMLPATLRAQHSTIAFDLGNYSLPDLTYHALDVKLDLSGYYAKLENQSIYLATDLDRTVTSSQGNLMLYLQPVYRLYMNRSKLQLEQDFQIGNLRFDYQAERYSNALNELAGGSTTNKYGVSGEFIYSGEVREYLVGKFFLEQDLNFYLNPAKNHLAYERWDTLEVINSTRTDDDLTSVINTEFILQAGWGRIERVEDARLAVYILDDLNKSGRLSRPVTEADIHALALVISSLRNERFFDLREKKIWELRQIDSVLTQMNLVEENDMVYFTLLDDNWGYADGPVRESGFRISGGIHTLYNYDHDRNTMILNFYNPDSVFEENDVNTDYLAGAGLTFRLRYEKPVNLYWQLSVENTGNFYTSYSYSENSSSASSGPEETNENKLEVSEYLNITAGYYPNTRTSILFYANSQYRFGSYLDYSDLEGVEYAMLNHLGISMNYYFSPRLQVNVNARLVNENIWDIDEEENSDRNSRTSGMITAGINYKIF